MCAREVLLLSGGGATPRYVETAFSLRLEEGGRTERAPRESVVPLVGLTR